MRALSTFSVKPVYKPNEQAFACQQSGIKITENAWISKHFISNSGENKIHL
jgi:hypothetical protein